MIRELDSGNDIEGGRSKAASGRADRRWAEGPDLTQSCSDEMDSSYRVNGIRVPKRSEF